MGKQREKACGADIHKNTIVATVNAGLKVLNTAKIIVLSPINIYAPP